MSVFRETGGVSLREDLDLFVEHETLRVGIMERMEGLLARVDSMEGSERRILEREIRALSRQLNRLDRLDRKRADRLVEQAVKAGDRRLMAQLEALRSRYGRSQWGFPVLDVEGLSKTLKQGIARGVSTIMLCGVIAIGTSQPGPGKVSISSWDLSNREEIHEVANIPEMLGLPER
nr:hypothetical protein [uncultured Dethiosulfovibrio sp.]